MRKKAFTLLELSIVLVIIGLLLGGSFKAMKMMRERTKTQEAKEQLLAAKNAVIGNTLKNLNLGLPDSEFFNEYLSPVKNNQNPIFYVANTNLINNHICAFSTTNLRVVDKGTNPEREIKNVAFVLAHEGVNYNMQTALIDNTVNIYGPDAKVDDNTTPINRVEHYDDIVEWVTLDELQRYARCSDTPLRIVNSSLPSTDQNSPYLAKIIIDGNYTAPSTFNCVIESPYDTYFSWNSATYEISSNLSRQTGTAVVDCRVEADDKNVSKKFTITINP